MSASWSKSGDWKAPNPYGPFKSDDSVLIYGGIGLVVCLFILWVVFSGA